MPVIEYGGLKVNLDDEGYLVRKKHRDTSHIISSPSSLDRLNGVSLESVICKFFQKFP